MENSKKRKLTAEELREYNDAYEMAINDDKPYITSSRLKGLMKSLGYNPTDHEINSMCLQVDYDRNGRLNFEEFVEIMDSMKNPSSEEESMLESFRAFDNFDKGVVPAKDIRDALLYIMEKSLPHEKELVIKSFGLDKDRYISYNEFKRMVSTDEFVQGIAKRNMNLAAKFM